VSVERSAPHASDSHRLSGHDLQDLPEAAAKESAARESEQQRGNGDDDRNSPVISGGSAPGPSGLPRVGARVKEE